MSKIAVVSGKGGTGKTLVATNISYMASKNQLVTLCDMDAEEPNAHLFFNFSDYTEEPVNTMIPMVDQNLCESCGTCSKICEFNAIIDIGSETLVFPGLCHSCYSCLELCPSNAIREGMRNIGKIRYTNFHDNLRLIESRINVGEMTVTELLKKVKMKISGNSELQIIDSPPGNSCAIVEIIKDVDYIIVVAEPTIFGFHDFKLIVESINLLQKPFAVIINKSSSSESVISKYCIKKGIKILGVIPLDKRFASEYASGDLICKNNSSISEIFGRILGEVNVLETESTI
jgi:MinD superfamily P-loop ATPase